MYILDVADQVHLYHVLHHYLLFLNGSIPFETLFSTQTLLNAFSGSIEKYLPHFAFKNNTYFFSCHVVKSKHYLPSRSIWQCFDSLYEFLRTNTRLCGWYSNQITFLMLITRSMAQEPPILTQLASKSLILAEFKIQLCVAKWTHLSRPRHVCKEIYF